MSTKLKRAVAKGATVLDGNRPGWHRIVKISELDMINPEKCVLGQLKGNYWEGAVLMGIHPREFESHGFVAPLNKEPQESYDAFLKVQQQTWSTLTELWKNEIRKRRKGKNGC